MCIRDRLKAPSGRIFCFYNHNTDNLRQVRANFPSGYWNRVDSPGHYVFRYSDDCGKSWSDPRTEIPIRETQIDRENPYGGQVRFFWNVGRPLTANGQMCIRDSPRKMPGAQIMCARLADIISNI